jgi:hypothetical protein
MKKVLLTATFVLASFGAFASNAAVKSNAIVPVKNNVEVKSVDKKQPVTCTVTVSVVVAEFSVSWCCANCE